MLTYAELPQKYLCQQWLAFQASGKQQFPLRNI